MKKVAILALLAAIIIACQSTENKTVSTTDSTETDSMIFELTNPVDSADLDSVDPVN